MSYRFFEATVVNVIDEAPNVKRFFIKMPHDSFFSFQAGQFIRLRLPIDEKNSSRSYSIASPPGDDGVFELCIAMNPSGKGTPYIFENFKTGRTVEVSKAFGKFILPDSIETDLCFICTGTGIAPLRSMLLSVFQKNIPHHHIYLVFGTRRESDILYRTEMEELARLHPEFRYIPVLSRENPGWSGATGYVHAVYENLIRGKKNMHFYVCGWHVMLKEAKERLEKLGYDREVIRFESYN